MKTKSIAGALVIAASFLVVGTVQAGHCYKQPSGWHMVSKKCNIKPAENWRQYQSGVYTQPVTKKGFLLF